MWLHKKRTEIKLFFKILKRKVQVVRRCHAGNNFATGIFPTLSLLAHLSRFCYFLKPLSRTNHETTLLPPLPSRKVPVTNLPECGNFLLFLFSQLPPATRLKYYIFPLDAPSRQGVTVWHLLSRFRGPEVRKNKETTPLPSGQLKKRDPSVSRLVRAAAEPAGKGNAILHGDRKTRIRVRARPRHTKSTHFLLVLANGLFRKKEKCKSVFYHNTEF